MSNESSNGLFAEIVDQCRDVVNAFTVFIQMTDSAQPEDFMAMNVEMTRIQIMSQDALHLIQAVLLRLTPERRDLLLDLLKQILQVSEEAKQAHVNLMIKVYGEDIARAVVALSEQIIKE
jgi:hypothetical protein